MKLPIRRILLIWPQFETSFWGMQYSLHQVGKKAVMAPLALVTVAGMLPKEKYEFRHLDLNYQKLHDDDLAWADLVMLSGWGPQFRSILWVARKARKAGKKVLIGGPLASEYHSILRNLDHVFVGEAEGFDLDGLIGEIAADNAPHIVRGPERPDLAEHILPRFDLLDMTAYWQATVQYARGCPFTCEFCDIIELYGRVQRTKSADGMVRELQSLHDLGFRGPLFFVDDNFYGNRKNIQAILPSVIDFQKRNDYPFYLHTEASLNLAKNTNVLEMMKDAGFYCMFTGIETPSKESLKETRKVQNLDIDLVDVIEVFHDHEIYVQAGFIMGFDSDPDDIGERIVEYVAQTGITVAMTGLLLSLPDTQLERRLVAEGRMMELAGIDQFGLPNFITKLHPRALLEQFDQVLKGCFSAEALGKRLSRQKQVLAKASPIKRDLGWQELTFYADHLRQYSQKVQKEMDTLRTTAKFTSYVEQHERYWSDKATSERAAPAPAVHQAAI